LTYPERLECACERAAIMEFEGGLTRHDAEHAAARAHAVKVEDIRAYFEKRVRA
jgi:hypothetical protein